MKTTKSDFFERVYSIVRKIPFGRVTTYGLVANAIGAPGSARMVGWALNKSFSTKEFVPAHRVVNRNGYLTGKKYFGDINLMANLLKSEGINVENDKVLNFENVLWNPIDDLNCNDNF